MHVSFDRDSIQGYAILTPSRLITLESISKYPEAQRLGFVEMAHSPL